jgi:hypothetical protein
MDIFIEKIVAKKKNTLDLVSNIGAVLAGFILCAVVLSIKQVSGFAPIIVIGVGYGVYRLIIAKNIEFEYAVTNGDLDIDKIISQRKRKRIFSSSCKDFDVVAKIGSVHFTQDIKNIKKRIEAVSSVNSSNVYFVALHYKGEKTVLFFEPDKRMLDAFKTFIPRKVFE